eukprot:5037080-Prymnesium_polylepis.1
MAASARSASPPICEVREPHADPVRLSCCCALRLPSCGYCRSLFSGSVARTALRRIDNSSTAAAISLSHRIATRMACVRVSQVTKRIQWSVQHPRDTSDMLT